MIREIEDSTDFSKLLTLWSLGLSRKTDIDVCTMYIVHVHVCRYEFTCLCDDPLPKQTSYSAVYLAYAFQFGRDQQW